jgi:membrane-associated phospholipid phosphatase
VLQAKAVERTPILPRGWVDVIRQILLFAGAYYCYRIVRGVTDGSGSIAYQNARDLIGIERALGIFIEPTVQAWTQAQGWLMDSACWLYLNCHFTITIAILVYIYLVNNSSFYFIRNMFMIAMAIALIGYAAYPTAPPRFMSELGFSDSVAQYTGVAADATSVNLLFNPFAAVPSMHVAFALMLGGPLAWMAKRRWVKALWLIYPVAVTFAVIATANHFTLDAVFGAVTAALAVLGALLIARIQQKVQSPKSASA